MRAPSDDLQVRLARLFERHGVSLEADEGWLLTEDDFPAVRAGWREGAAGEPGRLDIDVVLDEERHIELSYGGAGDEPVGDALARFARGDLPVLLAACWYVTDDRELDLAHWELGVRGWDVFIGRMQVKGAEVAPPEVASAIATALEQQALAPKMHWIRLFLRRGDDGELTVETLLDNEPWPAGDRAVAGLAWPVGGQAYSARGLLVLDVRDY